MRIMRAAESAPRASRYRIPFSPRANRKRTASACRPLPRVIKYLCSSTRAARRASFSSTLPKGARAPPTVFLRVLSLYAGQTRLGRALGSLRIALAPT